MKYTVQPGDTLSTIASKHKLSLDSLLQLNPIYLVAPDIVRVGAVIEIGDKAEDYFHVSRGQLTFDAEGAEDKGLFFSRVAHVPGPWSGVTIGRGYDCKQKSPDKITTDMNAAGIKATSVKLFAGASGLAGKDAEKYVTTKLKGVEITPRQQWMLFNITYDELELDVIQICNKHAVLAKYGITRWPKLDRRIRDVVVDLRYRGDYTSQTRNRIQPLLVNQDLHGFHALITDRVYWVQGYKVPLDRFNRRAAHIHSLI